MPGGRRRTIETALRDGEAARLRSRGLSYAEVGEQLGIDTATAYRAVQRAMVEAVREPADEVRALELARLDRLMIEAWQVLERRHVTVSNGKVVTLDGETVEDDGPVLAAIDRILKIQDRRARYLGLDAPTRVEMITLEGVDAEIARLERELAGREARQAPAASEPAG